MASKKIKDVSISEKYKKMNQHEHVLALPDTYIGGVELDSYPMWVYNEESNKMESRIIQFVPGLYKIFDEILVNSRDHSVNDKTCRNIKVTINKQTGEISCWNDGNNGIPIVIHPEHNIYVPEMIFGVLLTSGHYGTKGKTVGGKNGFGAKLCLKKGTLIPTFNGEVKKIEDIKQGEQLVGDDGTARTVLSKTEGHGKLFEVTQQRCDPYIVNEDHILSLKMPDHKVIFWNETELAWNILWLNKKEMTIQKKSVRVGTNTKESNDALIKMNEFAKTISDDNTIDISIKDYMNLSSTTKLRLHGYTGKCVQWQYKDVKLDPYVLGLWLGNGSKNGYSFAINSKADPEILEYLNEWGNANDAEFTQEKNNCVSYIVTSKSGCYIAPLKKLLSEYNLINNKHIPNEYLINSRDVRLKILAGLIDSDGYVDREGTRIVIKQGMNHEKLTKDIIFLVKSLGLMCCYEKCNTQWTHKEKLKRGIAIAINISGNDCKDIPTKVFRKKCCSPLKRDTTNTGTLSIKQVEDGDFIGLGVDQNQRFVLNDFTVTHNCNIFSTDFYIEIGDSKNSKVYKQHFSNNMYTRNNPVIDEKQVEKSYTFIKFKPDFKRFGITELTDDIISLFYKRVYDIAATTRETVAVYLNEKRLGINNFQDYIKMFDNHDDSNNADGSDDENETDSTDNCVYEKVNDRWEIGVVYDPTPGYRQVSYVNGICTYKGGRHVDYIVNQVIKGLANFIQQKHKDLKVKTAHIRDNITVFINSIIEDPSFSSQTKEELTSKVTSFGSECKISDDFIKKLSKTGIIEEIVNFAKLKAMAELKKTDGKKRSNLKDVEKLVDAHWAGTKKSNQCRLFLTEGDSAKAFAISGMSVIGKERFGVFPLRGKLLNVREAKLSQLANNEEIKNIKQILGLKQNKKYKDTSELRYGGIIILTDSDVDGSHIKGLVMNFIHYFWPSLMQIDGFIQSMATPIVKAWKTSDPKKKNPKIFYTLTDYENWQKSLGGNLRSAGWKSKYYKGLGTSDEKEAQEAFNDFEKRLISYIWNHNNDGNNDANNNVNLIENADDDDSVEDDVEEQTEDKEDEQEKSETQNEDDEEDFNFDKQNKNFNAITLAFAKTRADDRKNWLKNYDRSNIIENNITNVPFYDFVNKDLIHFSNYDCIRSIPSLVDGFKPGQRKIMYVSMKSEHNLLRGEMKVAQLAGYVSAEAAYHHGEAALQETIIGMAQNFVSSNNINLLTPIGNFGFRKLGGKDAASPRYIFTQLNQLVPYIFRKEDEKIYKYVEDDGYSVEPEFYAPIIPMVLINGSAGIGTGFSSNVPCYNPIDIINNIRLLLDNKEPLSLKPWYNGFKGSIVKLNDNIFRTCGVYEIINETTIKITELPLYTWTEKYNTWLETLVLVDKKNPGKNQIIESIKDDSGNNNISITIKFLPGILQKLIQTNKLEKTLKLYKNIGTSNMHLYNSKSVIQKFASVSDILKSFYSTRLSIYETRKEYYMKILENDLNLLKYKILFLKYVINGKIIVFENKKAISKEIILKRLEELDFPKLSNNAFAYDDDKSYSYITNIKFFDITPEEMAKLEDEFGKVQNEYEVYKNTPVKQIWLSEIDELVVAYNKWLKEQDDTDQPTKSKKSTAKKSTKGPLKVDTKKAKN